MWCAVLRGFWRAGVLWKMARRVCSVVREVWGVGEGGVSLEHEACPFATRCPFGVRHVRWSGGAVGVGGGVIPVITPAVWCEGRAPSASLVGDAGVSGGVSRCMRCADRFTRTPPGALQSATHGELRWGACVVLIGLFAPRRPHCTVCRGCAFPLDGGGMSDESTEITENHPWFNGNERGRCGFVGQPR